VIKISSSVISLSHTATDDNKFHLSDVDLWASEANIHVLTNDAKYGDFDTQEATITTNDVPFFRNFNIRDIYFKNDGAAANTKIVIVGIRMRESVMKELGIK
jgi:hypothetical protein